MTDIEHMMALAASMEYFAEKQIQALPEKQQAIIAAIRLADDIKKQIGTPHYLAARLRGTARRYRPSGCLALCAYMDSIAEQLDGPTPLLPN